MLFMNKEPLSLSWEISVLAKCLHFPNLSVASQHVGLSQPQISRIIKRLEEELQLELLDRQSRRHSHWTAAAHRLAEEYLVLHRNFQDRLLAMQNRSEQAKIRIGTLEGLMSVASQLAHHLFEADCTENIELNIYDLNELSEHFGDGQLDLVLTSRESGRRKFPIWRHIGYQTLDLQGTRDSELIVESPSEDQSVLRMEERASQKVLISNSLALRHLWIDTYGAHGRIPSHVFRTKSRAPKGARLEPVYIMGSSHIKAATRAVILDFEPCTPS